MGLPALMVYLPAWDLLRQLLSDSHTTLIEGRWIAHHGIPHSEVFAAAGRGRPWVDQQWLAQLIDYEVFRAGGAYGLALFKTVLLCSSFAGLATLIQRRGASNLLIVACSMVALAGALVSLTTGAQELVLPLFVILLTVCLRDAEQDRPRWWLVSILPVFLLWAQLFTLVMCVGVAILYLVARAAAMARHQQWRAVGVYLGLALCARMASMATPYGTGMIHYYRALLTQTVPGLPLAGAQSPALGQLPFLILAVPVALVLGAVVLSLIKRQRRPRVLLALVVLCGIAASVAVRNIVWFNIVAALFLAESAQLGLQLRGRGIKS